jgi:hypothetical protein
MPIKILWHRKAAPLGTWHSAEDMAEDISNGTVLLPGDTLTVTDSTPTPVLLPVEGNVVHLTRKK